MKLEGGCYCGNVRYMSEGKPALKAQCMCAETHHSAFARSTTPPTTTPTAASTPPPPVGLTDQKIDVVGTVFNRVLTGQALGLGGGPALENVFGPATYAASVALIDTNNSDLSIQFWSKALRDVISAYTLWQRGAEPPNDFKPWGYGSWSESILSRTGAGGYKLPADVCDPTRQSSSVASLSARITSSREIIPTNS